MNSKKLLASGAIYTVSNIFVKGINFLTIPIFAAIMTQEAFGGFSLYASWVAIFSIVIGLQTNSVLNIGKRDYPDEYNRYLNTALSISTIFFVIVFWLIFIFKDYLSTMLNFSPNIILVLFIQSYLSYIFVFINSYFVFEEKPKSYSVVAFIYTLLNVLLSLVLVLNFENDQIVARIYGMFIPSAILAVIFYFTIYSKTRILLEKKFVSEIFILSFPIILHGLGNQILMQLDRIMISSFLGLKANALYSFGYNVALILNVVWSSLNSAWVPWYFEQDRLGNFEKIKEFAKNYIYIFTFITVIFLFISPEIVQLMGNEIYEKSKNFVPWLIASYFLVFLYSFPVNVEFLKKNTKLIPIGTLLAGISNYFLNLIMIPTYGIMGAAIATLFSYMLLFVFHYILVKVIYKYNDVHIGLLGGSFLFISCNTVLCVYLIENILVRYIFILVYLLLAIIKYKKNKIKGIYN
ncbi:MULTISPECIES: oligosaccharide flippase family protein [unclassified Exiguobacterium]|uniref:lipopolysaccharide biosynthesis protein n=1 Tax=unclassified Exiguobacterium TaxID=2644629 RepID=UPI001BE583AF|nr:MULTISPECIES: oligosaccharide flippase family protein [unclassified Exiguobacterium]